MENYQEFAGLAETGFENKEPVKPEDEFFHALYISGKTRENHVKITEEIGKLQIRGYEYNLDQANMIITHVKKVLSKTVDNKTKCFCYKPGPPPWFGWDNKQCGTTSAERAADHFCAPCREQIIVGGIYCDAGGTPIMHPDTGKPVFIFIRGKGMKYNNVSQYLTDMTKMEIDPLFTPPTAESQSFEKTAVNNKRFVTNIVKGTTESKHGEKDVFVLSTGAKLPNETVMNILRIAKETKDKFQEKMDWSKTPAAGGATGYAGGSAPQSNQIPEANKQEAQSESASEAPKTDTPAPQTTFNFDDISF